MLTQLSCPAQQAPLNKYGLQVIESKKELDSSIVENKDMRMVNLRTFIPGIKIDLKYCGADNFMKTPLYPTNLKTTYLRVPAATALKAVQESLRRMNLSLKIWDAYRPYAVTEKMWEPVKDDRYAADPKFGSGHNRGIAVDLTIVDRLTGKELDMGTGFDHFSDTAHSDFKNLPGNVLINRLLLRNLMEQNGFKVLDTEWWHFYLPDGKKYPLLNLEFSDLRFLSSGSKIKY